MELSQSTPSTVLISYSHDSPEHEDHVLGLANRLRGDGIDAVIDQYDSAPPEGWARWMRNAIRSAAFVLVISTETYRRRAEGNEEPGKGRGVNREGFLIDQQIYAAGGKNQKFIAVILRQDDSAFIPDFLQPFQMESTETEDGYERLYRRLTNQPKVVKPDLGMLRSLPLRERKTSFMAPFDKAVPAGMAVVWSQEQWDPSILAKAKQDLAPYTGPIASVIVDRAARKARTPRELYQALATEISSEPDRAQFLKQMQNPR